MNKCPFGSVASNCGMTRLSIRIVVAPSVVCARRRTIPECGRVGNTRRSLKSESYVMSTESSCWAISKTLVSTIDLTPNSMMCSTECSGNDSRIHRRTLTGTFSSRRKRISGYSRQHSRFTYELCGVGDRRFDVLFSEVGVLGKNLVEAIASLKETQDIPHHHPCSPNCRLAATDIGVQHDSCEISHTTIIRSPEVGHPPTASFAPRMNSTWN